MGASCLPVALFAAILLAFLLSLCSSSADVVARSMAGTFHGSASDFLVFWTHDGYQNVMMLRGYFKASLSGWRLRYLQSVFGVVTAGLLGGGMAG